MSTEDVRAVEVTTDVAASPATVYRFLADPERMTQWLGAMVELEPRAGGLLRVRFDRFGTVVRGEVVELVPGKRAVYTWGVESGPQQQTLPAGSTRVVITLEPIESGTRVTLRHEGLPSEQERLEHEGGWRYYAGQIALLAAREERAPRALASVDAFVAAWNEVDDGARRDLLERSFADDGVFEDQHAAVAGAAALGLHVAQLQRLLPGLRLRRVGDVQLVRDAIRFQWIVAAADGTPLAAGVNFADLAPDTRLRRVVGFTDAPDGG